MLVECCLLCDGHFEIFLCAVLAILVEMKTALVVIVCGTIIGAVFAMILYSYLYYLKYNQDKDY